MDHSLPAGVSAQTTVKTLSGWSGEIRGEIAVKLVLVALPLRPRLSFEIRGFCEAQSDAHSELTPNFAAQAAANLLLLSEVKPHQPDPKPRTPRKHQAKYAIMREQNDELAEVSRW